MVKLEIDVIRPNLQVKKAEYSIGEGHNILYSVYQENLIKSARAINNIVKKHIA